jgi:hypothetical protein
MSAASSWEDAPIGAFAFPCPTRSVANRFATIALWLSFRCRRWRFIEITNASGVPLGCQFFR